MQFRLVKRVRKYFMTMPRFLFSVSKVKLVLNMLVIFWAFSFFFKESSRYLRTKASGAIFQKHNLALPQCVFNNKKRAHNFDATEKVVTLPFFLFISSNLYLLYEKWKPTKKLKKSQPFTNALVRPDRGSLPRWSSRQLPGLRKIYPHHKSMILFNRFVWRSLFIYLFIYV